jgi:hypothetical protein
MNEKHKIISVCSIPHPDGDRSQTWVVVLRKSPLGEDIYSIEYFDEELNLDSGLMYDGTVDDVDITLAAVSGTGVNVEASADIFASGDVGKAIKAADPAEQVAIGIITAFVDAKNVTVDIAGTFPRLTFASEEWGLAVTTVDGLDHLAFFEVSIVGDGVVYPKQFVTAGGAVDLDGGLYPHSLKVQVGLPFEPVIRTLRPAQQIQIGNTLFFVKGYNRVYTLLKDTAGATINDEQIKFRSVEDPMDAKIPLFTGIKEVVNLGYDREQIVEIKQPVPLPIHVLGVMGSLDVGEE